MELNDEEVARVIHGAQRQYQAVLDDPMPSEPWDALEQWAKDGLIRAVRMIRDGASPHDIHAEWVQSRKDLGWEYGEHKNPQAEPPTHPCILPWNELSEEQRYKDILTWCIATALDDRIGWVLRD